MLTPDLIQRIYTNLLVLLRSNDITVTGRLSTLVCNMCSVMGQYVSESFVFFFHWLYSLGFFFAFYVEIPYECEKAVSVYAVDFFFELLQHHQLLLLIICFSVYSLTDPNLLRSSKSVLYYCWKSFTNVCTLRSVSFPLCTSPLTHTPKKYIVQVRDRIWDNNECALILQVAEKSMSNDEAMAEMGFSFSFLCTPHL